MKRQLLFIRFLAIVITLLFTLSAGECNAQRNASRKFEKETFGKSRKSTGFDEGKAHGKAAKAMKEQEKKKAMRASDDEKQLKELRKQHLEKQSADTRLRMENNIKTTDLQYKTKRQKQKKDQVKPELNQPGQPKPAKDQAKPKTQDPGKQPKLKQQKQKAKSKMVNPKKQPKLKQHKIKKY